MAVEQQIEHWSEDFAEKLKEVHRGFLEELRRMGGEEMAEPKVVNTSTASTQLDLDFGERFREVAWKETDKVVVRILQGLAILGLDESETNTVMTTIAKYAPDIAGHEAKE